MQTRPHACSISTLSLVRGGLSIALVFVATMFVNLRLPIAANGDLIHLGNVPLFACAILFGKRIGAVAGAFGMALFDLVSGWTAWAPFTFVIVGCMGYAVGAITKRTQGKRLTIHFLAMLAALVIKVMGYYLAEIVLYGSFVAPLASIPGNVVQIVTAIVITLPLMPILTRLTQRMPR